MWRSDARGFVFGRDFWLSKDRLSMDGGIALSVLARRERGSSVGLSEDLVGLMLVTS